MFNNFSDLGVNIVGISSDDIKTHREFIKTHDLPYPLLSDLEHAASRSYGIWKETSTSSRPYWSVQRVTYIIDDKSYIRSIISKTKPDEHPQKALDILDNAIKKNFERKSD
jgi:thioredoxin-dependent peroxiredoxin